MLEWGLIHGGSLTICSSGVRAYLKGRLIRGGLFWEGGNSRIYGIVIARAQYLYAQKLTRRQDIAGAEESFQFGLRLVGLEIVATSALRDCS